LIAPLHFCLVGILLTGRVLVAYHDAFEQPLPPPPTPIFADAEEISDEADLQSNSPCSPVSDSPGEAAA
jgi:hypothetical protein